MNEQPNYKSVEVPDALCRQFKKASILRMAAQSAAREPLSFRRTVKLAEKSATIESEAWEALKNLHPEVRRWPTIFVDNSIGRATPYDPEPMRG